LVGHQSTDPDIEVSDPDEGEIGGENDVLSISFFASDTSCKNCTKNFFQM
jgi:hypothetical protein